MKRWSRMILAPVAAVGLCAVPALTGAAGASAATGGSNHGGRHASSHGASSPTALPKGVNASLASRATAPSGEVDIAALSADGSSVVYYFAPPGKAFSGPFTVGPSDYVQPAIVLRPNGEVDILTISGGHLEYYWNFPGTQFFGPLQIGTDSYTDMYAPQMLARNANEVDVAAINDSGQLQYFWDFPGHAFDGPAVVQSNLSYGLDGYGLSMALRPNGELDIVSNADTSGGSVTPETSGQSANADTSDQSGNSLNYFWDFPGQPFQGPAPVSASTNVDGASQGFVVRPNGEADVAYSDWDGTNYQTYVVTDAPGHPFATPALVAPNEDVDTLAVRSNGEVDLLSEPYTNSDNYNDYLSVNYRWSFTGTTYAGPITALDPKGSSIESYSSMAIGTDGVVHAANCLSAGGDSPPSIVLFQDAPGQYFGNPGLVGPGCNPSVIVRP